MSSLFGSVRPSASDLPVPAANHSDHRFNPFKLLQQAKAVGDVVRKAKRSKAKGSTLFNNLLEEAYDGEKTFRSILGDAFGGLESALGREGAKAFADTFDKIIIDARDAGERPSLSNSTWLISVAQRAGFSSEDIGDMVSSLMSKG